MGRLLLLRCAWMLVVACSAGAGCATTSGAAEPDAPGTVHVVKPGETVFDIARDSGLSVEEILEVNGLQSSSDLGPGDRVFLPAGRIPPRVTPRAPEREEPLLQAGTELRWPVDGVVLRDFTDGKARGAPYDGLLLAAPAGTAVVAAAEGRVAFAGDQGTAYGRFVVLEHGGGLVTIYANLEAVSVKTGASVKAGDPLGTVGTSGGQESPRLHFQVRRGRTAVDPQTMLPE